MNSEFIMFVIISKSHHFDDPGSESYQDQELKESLKQYCGSVRNVTNTQHWFKENIVKISQEKLRSQEKAQKGFLRS